MSSSDSDTSSDSVDWDDDSSEESIEYNFTHYSYMPNQPIKVIFEGNIASGKSSLLRYLDNTYMNVDVKWEPVDEWVNDKGKNILSEYYANPKENGLAFQLKVMNSMTMRALRAVRDRADFVFEERSVDSAINVFSPYMVEMNFLKPEVLGLLKETGEILHSLEKRAFGVKFRSVYIIYCRSTPLNCFNRNQTREGSQHNRDIPQNIFDAVHRNYENWLRKLYANTMYGQVRVFMLDTSLPMDQTKAELRRILATIQQDANVELKETPANAAPRHIMNRAEWDCN